MNVFMSGQTIIKSPTKLSLLIYWFVLFPRIYLTGWYRYFWNETCKRIVIYKWENNNNKKMSSFKCNENIHKKEDGSYDVISANKASSVTV